MNFHIFARLAMASAAASTLFLAGCEQSEPEQSQDVEPAVNDNPKLTDDRADEVVPLPRPDVSGETSQIVLPGLTFDVPVEWKQQIVTSSMRAAAFEIAPPDGSEILDNASLVIYDFGPTGAGDVQANFNRWMLQMSQPDGTPSADRADQWTVEMNGITVHYLEVAGTYVAETTPGSGMRVNKPDYKLIGTIVETEDRPYYFKLTGPTAVVEAWKPEYMKMIDSFRSPDDTSIEDDSGRKGTSDNEQSKDENDGAGG